MHIWAFMPKHKKPKQQNWHFENDRTFSMGEVTSTGRRVLAREKQELSQIIMDLILVIFRT